MHGSVFRYRHKMSFGHCFHIRQPLEKSSEVGFKATMETINAGT